MTATVPPPKLPDARSPEARVASMFVERWSRRAFSPRAIPEETIRSLFEAARWAPSARNLQPWLFIYADEPESLARARPVLSGSNRRWADKAPLLIFAFARKTHPKSGEPLGSAAFDTGAAWMSLALQAHMLGLVVHPMGGFDHDAAYEAFGVPRETFGALAAIAVGFPGDVADLPEDLRAREQPSERRPVSAFALRGRYR